MKRVPHERIKKSMFLEDHPNYPTCSFTSSRVPSSTVFSPLGPIVKVYPTNKIAYPKFSGDFESGNLGTVFKTGPFSYEVSTLPDPSNTAQWFFFKCEKLGPGTFTFVVSGFYRDTGLHHHNVSPVYYSMNQSQKGIGWSRISPPINYWRVGTEKKSYSMSFSISVPQTDTIYFAYLYPYTFTQLDHFLRTLLPRFKTSIIATTSGGIQIPAIFWDADSQQCQDVSLLSDETTQKKPLIMVVSRLHPGESNSSYAMEGFLQHLQNNSKLLECFSFLLVPMINVDGVVCGFYRPSLLGVDMNRVWLKPTKGRTTESFQITEIVDKLATNRNFVFFLDFHGHSGEQNSFTYGVCNPDTPLNEYEREFSNLMSIYCGEFDISKSWTYIGDVLPVSMRVGYQNRYQIPFSYTLEISYGGNDLKEPKKQMTPKEYRHIGECVVKSISDLLIGNEIVRKRIESLPPPRIYRGRVFDSDSLTEAQKFSLLCQDVIL